MRDLLVGLLVAAGAFVVGYAVLLPGGMSFLVQHVAAAQPNASCRIKGNINLGGERIYHLPGQRYYGATRIDPAYGERWFCTEADARAAGFRRAKI